MGYAAEAPLATLAGRSLLSNRGVPLNLEWVKQVRVNTSAVERRAQTHVTRRTVKKEWQAAWLLRAISCMDLTTLSGDDTEERVRRMFRRLNVSARDAEAWLGILRQILWEMRHGKRPAD